MDLRPSLIKAAEARNQPTDIVRDGAGIIRRAVSRFIGGDDVPPNVVAKMQKLRDEADDAMAGLQFTTRKIHDLADEKGEIRSRLGIAELSPSQGGLIGGGKDSGQAKKLRVQLAAVEQEILRLEEIAAPRRERANSTGQLLARCEDYVGRYQGLPLYHGRLPGLPKGMTAIEAVETARQKISEIGMKIAETEAAPRPSSECKAAARAYVETMAEQGRPDCFGMFETGALPRWPVSPLDVFVAVKDGQAVARSECIDPVALLAYVCKADLINALEREIDEGADDANAISEGDRAARIGSLRNELLEIERAEEHFICLAGDGVIARRANADPGAVLGVIGPPPRDM